MSTGWFAGYRARLRGRLRAAFTQDHPPRLVAGSFAVGLFLATIPTLGVALVVIGWLGYRVDRANRLALLAAATLMNPLAKGTIYAASFGVGVLLLGPVPGIASADVSLDAGPDVLARILVGNAVLAVGFAVLGYAAAYHAVRTYRRRGG